MTLRKRYALGVLLGIIIITSLIYYQYQQPPTSKDVYASTKNWNPPITKVYTIQKTGSGWITFFRSEKMLYVGSLEQSWSGKWKLIHEVTKDEMPLGSTSFDLDDTGLVFGVSGVSKGGKDISYYYGVINNPKINSIIIEAEGKTFDEIPLIEVNGRQFFFLRKHGDSVPYKLKAINNNGEIVYEGQ